MAKRKKAVVEKEIDVGDVFDLDKSKAPEDPPISPEMPPDPTPDVSTEEPADEPTPQTEEADAPEEAETPTEAEASERNPKAPLPGAERIGSDVTGAGAISDLFGEDFDITDADKVPTASVSYGPEAKFLSFSTEAMMEVLRVLTAKKIMASEVLARSLHFTVFKEEVELRATDGIYHFSARIPARSQNFPSGVILDIEALYSVLKTSAAPEVFLVAKEDGVYVNFYGGEVYIATYRVPEERFEMPRTDAAEKSHIFVVGNLLATLQAVSVILHNNKTPELGYIFFQGGHVYITNGFCVCRVMDSVSVDAAWTVTDMDVIHKIMSNANAKQATMTRQVDGYLLFKAATFEYRFPKPDVVIPDQFTQVVANEPPFTFFISNDALSSIARTLRGLPESSNVLTIEVEEDKLMGKFADRSGHESAFVISESADGTIPEGLHRATVVLSELSNSLYFFQGYDTIEVGFMPSGDFHLKSDTLSQVVVLSS